MTPPQEIGRRTLPVFACSVTLLLSGALKLYSARYGAGDENMYFYMATRAAEGILPYRDYTFAHHGLLLHAALCVRGSTRRPRAGPPRPEHGWPTAGSPSTKPART